MSTVHRSLHVYRSCHQDQIQRVVRVFLIKHLLCQLRWARAAPSGSAAVLRGQQVTRGPVPLPDGMGIRLLPAAHIHRVRAAGVEATARRGVGQTGHLSLQNDPFPAAVRVGYGCRGEEGLGVGMLRRAGDGIPRGDLDDLPQVQDRDAVTDVLHHTQSVGDEHVGQTEIFLELEEVGDLADIYVNDAHVAMRAWEPFEAEITDFVKAGENTLIIKVANSFQNFICHTPKSSGILGEVRIAAYEA